VAYIWLMTQATVHQSQMHFFHFYFFIYISSFSLVIFSHLQSSITSPFTIPFICHADKIGAVCANYVGGGSCSCLSFQSIFRSPSKSLKFAKFWSKFRLKLRRSLSEYIPKFQWTVISVVTKNALTITTVIHAFYSKKLKGLFQHKIVSW
jgi:hypothetical protein